MKKQAITAAITATIIAANVSTAHASEPDAYDSSKPIIGTGIGAVAGGLVAGPIGLLAGGLIGNLAGRHDAATAEEQAHSSPDADVPAQIPTPPAPVQATEQTVNEPIVVSQAGDIKPITDKAGDPDSGLKDILVNSVGLDVLFLTGSTAVEAIYQPRLQAIAEIMQRLPEVQVHLDGYSDRRGQNDANLELSNKRLESVRDQLVQSGGDPDRIHVTALGEQQFMSRPGDLEAYTFDRRVVIRFEHPIQDNARPIALIQEAPSI